jgi:N-methylhydantoinase A
MPEITGVRLVTQIETPSPSVIKGCSSPASPAKVAKQRRANLGQGYQPTNVVMAADLHPGSEIVGPAIIEETFTTIVVYPGWKARVDDARDYELTRMKEAVGG